MATGRLYDRLAAHFGAESLFMDIDTIPLGMDFRQVIAEAVSQCTILLAVIGDRWLTLTGDDGRRRLDDPRDSVRLEIAAALERNIPVVPVLVQGARMPGEAELPAPLKPLAYRNAIELSHARFNADVARLIQGLEQLSGAMTRPVAMSSPPPADILPSLFAWIKIPAGQVILITEQGWAENYIPEGQSWTFNVPAFMIAKYPVTNVQYAQFMEAGGYHERRWWTEAGWQQKEADHWTQSRYWEDDCFNEPEQPVVGVSWYEAVAFCQWLSESSGEAIMLPTEQQWQRAAQGDDGREYPWGGNKWDGARCNNSVSPNDSHQTTLVRQYEGRGDSPFGVVDMAGNVWEWCRTVYETGSDELNGTDVRVLRSGSWFNYYSEWFRAAYRSWFQPQFRVINLGFRCARSC